MGAALHCYGILAVIAALTGFVLVFVVQIGLLPTGCDAGEKWCFPISSWTLPVAVVIGIAVEIYGRRVSRKVLVVTGAVIGAPWVRS